MSLEDDVNVWVTQAAELFRKREVIPAEKLFDRALRYIPHHEDALFGWGMLYAATGRGPLALRKIQEAQIEHPDQPGPYRAIGTLLRLAGKFDIAETYFNQILPSASIDASPFIHLGLAEIYASQSKQSELKEQMDILRNNPSVDPLLQGLLYFELGQYKDIERLSDLTDDEAIDLTLLGLSAELRGNMDEAGNYYYQVSELEDPTWVAINGLASMWLNAGEMQHCLSYLKDAEEMAPEATEVLLTRGMYLKEIGDKEEAKVIFDRILTIQSAFGRVKRRAKEQLSKR